MGLEPEKYLNTKWQFLRSSTEDMNNLKNEIIMKSEMSLIINILEAFGILMFRIHIMDEK